VQLGAPLPSVEARSLFDCVLLNVMQALLLQRDAALLSLVRAYACLRTTAAPHAESLAALHRWVDSQFAPCPLAGCTVP
jgi:hypothetical protein